MNLVGDPRVRSTNSIGTQVQAPSPDPVPPDVQGLLPEAATTVRDRPRPARRWISVVGGSVAALAVMLGAVGGSAAVTSAELGQSVGHTLSQPAAVESAANPQDPTALSGPIARHGKVEKVLKEAEADARRGVASTVTFLPSKGTKFKSWSFGYKTGEARRMNILEQPEGGIVRGTIVINPSGHTGQAESFARSNTYTVEITLPDGQKLVREGILRNVVARGLPPSTAEYATAIDVEYPYRRGVTQLSASPDGSGGAGGYVEGRLYLIHSHDQKWAVTDAWGASVRHLFDFDSHGPIPFPVPLYSGR